MRCPNCGAETPEATRCPGCGADPRTGRGEAPESRAPAESRPPDEDARGDAGGDAQGDTPADREPGAAPDSGRRDDDIRYGWRSPPGRESSEPSRGEGRGAGVGSGGGPGRGRTGAGVGRDGSRQAGPYSGPTGSRAGRYGAREGTARDAPGTAAGGPPGTTAAEPSGHERQGSPFEFAIEYPVSASWTTVAGWTLTFWGVLVAAAVVFGAATGLVGPARLTAGTLATAVLVLGPLPFLGYLLRTCRAAAEGDPAAPAFGGLRDTVALGFRGFAGLFALQFLLALPVLPATLLPDTALSSGVEVLVGLLILVAAALVAYLLPAFLTVVAVTGSLRQAFGTRRVAAFAFSKGYLVAALVGLALMIVLRLLAFVSILTIVGWVVVVPYTFVAMAAYWGEVYRKQVVTDEADAPTEPRPRSAARPVD